MASLSAPGLNIAESPLSQRVPKVRQTGETSKDFVLEQERNALISCINILWQYPRHRQAAKDFLLSRLRDEVSQQRIQDDGLFENKIKILSKVPDDWICAWLATRCKLTIATLGKIKAYDAQQIQHLWLFELGASAQLKVTDACNSKEVLTKVATQRAKNRGCVLESAHIDQFVDPNGKVNWGLAGEYTFEYDHKTSKLTGIEHRSSKVTAAIPEGMTITSDYEVHSNWAACKATLRKGPSTFKVIDFFPDKTGPKAPEHKLLTGDSDAWKSIVSAVTSALARAKAEKEQGEVRVDYDALNEPLKLRQKEATKKAREALEKHKAELTKRRRVTIGEAVGTS